MVTVFKNFTVGCLFLAIIPQMSARDAHMRPSTRVSYIKSGLIVGSKARNVHFTNDFGDLAALAFESEKNDGKPLDDIEQECVNHFRKRSVIIRAVKEYTTQHGDEVKVETHDSWELTFQELQNSQLSSLKAFRELVAEFVMMPKKDFENLFLNWVSNTYNKMKLAAIRLAMKKMGKTTFILDTHIDPDYESINCSDIILDLDECASKNKDSITADVDYSNLLHMRIFIKQA